MIIDNYVYLTISLERILNYYLDLGYDCVKKIPFKVKVKDLRDTEKVIVKCKCDECFNIVERPYAKYLNNKKKYYFACSPKCIRGKAKLTMIKKYGVEHAAQSKHFTDKAKKTNLERYGVECSLHSVDSKEKTKKTNLERYGHENAMSSKIIQERVEKTNLEKYGFKSPIQNKDIYKKLKKTNLERYGVECSLQSNIIKDKIKQTNLERYGHENAAQGEEAKQKIKNINLEKYGHEYYVKSKQYILDKIKVKKEKFINDFNILEKDIINIDINNITIHCNICDNNYTENAHFIHKRIKNGYEPCTNCLPYNTASSKSEKELLEFISNNYSGTIIEGDRKILEGKEIDIYLPDLGLAFEFNGVYWHSELFKEKDYHLKKTEKCLKKNINLIHVYEDDWLYKRDIVESRMLNMLGKSNRIFARKCIIKEVDSKEVRTFLNENHIQGFVGSNVKLGLYNEDILVSLMTFGGLRKNLGQMSKEGSYELLRFCNLLNTTVIGGASRLFKYFKLNYSPKDIISYADRSWSKGGLYENLGFTFVENTGVNYYYVLKDIRENRYKYRKDVLVKEGYDSSLTEHEIMISRDIYRIYDSGSMKFIWKIK